MGLSQSFIVVHKLFSTPTHFSLSDRDQHRPDVLRGAPRPGGAQRRHRRLPDGAQVVAHERRPRWPRRLRLLQQEADGGRRRRHQRGVSAGEAVVVGGVTVSYSASRRIPGDVFFFRLSRTGISSRRRRSRFQEVRDELSRSAPCGARSTFKGTFISSSVLCNFQLRSGRCQ